MRLASLPPKGTQTKHKRKKCTLIVILYGRGVSHTHPSIPILDGVQRDHNKLEEMHGYRAP